MTELIYAPQNLWTQYHEKLLLKWREKGIAYEWQHKRSAELYERLNYIFGIISIIFTIITSASFLVNFNDDAKCSGNLYYNISFGTLLIIASIFTSINTFFKYNEWAEKHKNCADKWRNYINCIDAELAFTKEERINGKIFMKQMQKRFNELIEICPNIPKYIQRKYDNIDVKEKLNELNEIIIDDSIIKYTNEHTNDSNDTNDTNDSSHSNLNNRADIQFELEQDLRGKQIKENINKYVSDNSNKPLTRVVNTL